MLMEENFSFIYKGKEPSTSLGENYIRKLEILMDLN